ncbi:competence protein ComK [Bacillus sp. B15-48]|uniref:competence protein ComK n=1 Tax=Bacillus sp. B15-48 TaxID=1548601 RepID=UPI00193FB560|nr:competence protein ComK [Bacillus sp. B15-48]MBM4765106.1 hypothetical protein [Bacillus sp. B15-48]
MFIEKQYLIQPQLVYMIGDYDRYGKLCTRIIETERTFIVDKSPLEIIDESIKWIGYDLRGATLTSKRLLGKIQMYPIMVNPIERIVLFPSKSPHHLDNIWFNPHHISRTKSHHHETLINFSNGFSLLLPIRLASFNTKIKNAEQLEAITAKRLTFVLDSDKRYSKNK